MRRLLAGEYTPALKEKLSRNGLSLSDTEKYRMAVLDCDKTRLSVLREEAEVFMASLSFGNQDAVLCSSLPGEGCFAILFPTYFECECFAGTALDAFAARIPIIANDWLYNDEAIRSGKDGFIYPFRDNDAAAAQLVRLYENRALYAAIQEGCEESMRRFSTENVMGEFSKRLS